MTELMVMTPGRPAVLDIAGCRIFVSVHDEYFRHTQKDFKQRLRLAHPDMNHQTKVTIEVGPVEVPAHMNRNGASGKRYLVPAYTLPARKVTYPTNAAGGQFRKIRSAYNRWLKEEKKWYAQYGLLPPEWGK